MLSAMGGPHILYAWLAGAVLALCDGLVYAQLGAALPGSGGPYLYLREAYRPFGLGGLMGFLFIFQVMLIAPLSIASGAVGFADYLRFYWTTMGGVTHDTVAARRGARHDGAALSQHPRRRPAVGGDAGDRRPDGRLGDRRRPVAVLAGAGVRLSARGAHARRRAGDPGRRRRAAGDVQLRRLQQCLQHRRRDPRSEPDRAARDRAVDRPGGGALRRDEHGDHRRDPVDRGTAVADHRLAVHRAHVRESRVGPHRGAGDDRADPVRHRVVAVRPDSRLLADSVRRRPRGAVLRRVRPAPSDQALPARVADHARRCSRCRSASSRSARSSTG